MIKNLFLISFYATAVGYCMMADDPSDAGSISSPRLIFLPKPIV